MTPKEYKEMMAYLTRSGVSKQVTFASDIARPDPKPEVKEIEAFNEFNKRNPRADGGRIPFGEAGFVVSNNKEKTKLKFTKKEDDIAEKVYNKSMKELYETNRARFHDIRFGRVNENTQAGKGKKIKTNIQIPTKDVKQPDGTIKKVELPVRYPNKKVEKNFKKAVRNIFKYTPNTIPYKTLAEDFPITERQAIRAAKQIKKDEGLEYAKGKTTQQYTKEVRNPLIDKTSSRQVEKRMGLEKQRFLKDQPELKGKIDIAHRASKSHMARFGLQFDTQTVGMDSRLINQVVLKPAENMLEKLYTKREGILDNIKGKPTKEQKEILKQINDSVKKVVKTTSGRFVGIIVDPNNLNPSFTGTKKDLAFSKVEKTIKDIAKLPGTPDALGGGYTKDSEYFKFIKDNVQKSVSGEIKRGFVPNDFKVILSDPKNRKNLLEYAKKNAPDILPQFKKILNNPASKESFALYSNPFFDPSLMGKVVSDLGKGINVGLGPTGILALNTALGVDPTQSIDRAGLGLEAALAKPLVRGATSVTDKIKNPMLRKIAERAALAGMSPTMAMKVASRLSPVGIASLGLEGLYQVGKLGYEDQQRFNALSPEEQAAERAEQEKFAFDIEGS